jgi:hypothetical protein
MINAQQVAGAINEQQSVNRGVTKSGACYIEDKRSLRR